MITPNVVSPQIDKSNGRKDFGNFAECSSVELLLPGRNLVDWFMRDEAIRGGHLLASGGVTTGSSILVGRWKVGAFGKWPVDITLNRK